MIKEISNKELWKKAMDEYFEFRYKSSVVDAEELRIEILKVLNKQKEFAEIIIDKEQKKLAAINNILKGVQNG